MSSVCPFECVKSPDVGVADVFSFNWDLGASPYIGYGVGMEVMEHPFVGKLSRMMYYSTDRWVTVARHAVEQWHDAETLSRAGEWERGMGVVEFRRIKNIRRDLPGGDGTLISRELLVASRAIKLDGAYGALGPVFLIMTEGDF